MTSQIPLLFPPAILRERRKAGRGCHSGGPWQVREMGWQKLWLERRKRISHNGVVWCGTRGPEGMGNLHPVRHSKFDWMRSWAACSWVWSWPYLEQEDGVQTSRCPFQHYSRILRQQGYTSRGNTMWWPVGIFFQMSGQETAQRDEGQMWIKP